MFPFNKSVCELFLADCDKIKSTSLSSLSSSNSPPLSLPPFHLLPSTSLSLSHPFTSLYLSPLPPSPSPLLSLILSHINELCSSSHFPPVTVNAHALFRSSLLSTVTVPHRDHPSFVSLYLKQKQRDDAFGGICSEKDPLEYDLYKIHEENQHFSQSAILRPASLSAPT